MKDLKVNINMGLGDMIIMAPYIAYLAQNNSVTIPSYEVNKESVKSFFIDYPNVNVVSYDPSIAWDINIGHTGDLTKKDDLNFIDWFYDQIGGTREEFLSYAPLEKASKRIGQYIVPSKDFIFIHDDPERRFYIKDPETKLEIIRPFKAGSILRYASLLYKAKEIHVIDSSFFHLCEALPTTGKLFYHINARPHSTTNYRFIKDWEVIK